MKLFFYCFTQHTYSVTWPDGLFSYSSHIWDSVYLTNHFNAVHILSWQTVLDNPSGLAYPVSPALITTARVSLWLLKTSWYASVQLQTEHISNVRNTFPAKTKASACFLFQKHKINCSLLGFYLIYQCKVLQTGLMQEKLYSVFRF